MTRGTDWCGGDTSSTRWVVDEYWNVNIAVLLPRGCLAGNRRLRYSADGPEFGRLPSPPNLEWTSLPD